jgi:hypothetical protein
LLGGREPEGEAPCRYEEELRLEKGLNFSVRVVARKVWQPALELAKTGHGQIVSGRRVMAAALKLRELAYPSLYAEAA